MPEDSQYASISYSTSELNHHYGKNIHLFANPFYLTLLAKLCAPETVQPQINGLVELLYTNLIAEIAAREFPIISAHIPTRMRDAHPEAGFYRGPIIDPATPVVSVNLARAGTFPSHVCYHALHTVIQASNLRQDHIGIARQTPSHPTAMRSEISGHKIGGSIADAIVLFPDPMGATGGTLCEALDHYKKSGLGRPKKWIALHCIVTPEYLKKCTETHPDLIIYALRLDRGLSADLVLKSELGKYWDQEKGLNANHYIVPGGGGFGEVMNNAYV